MDRIDRIEGIDEQRALGPAETVSRRGFVVGAGLTAGFAFAVRPVGAAVITTDEEGLAAGGVSIPTSDGDIPGYMARPETGGPFPLILVVQEIFGVHEHIRDICRRFAKLGHMAVAPELYFRQGDVSNLPFKEIFPIVARVPDAQVMSDLDAAVGWAAGTGKADDGKLAITGFCWGGRIVWLYAAHNPDLKAGVAWYGRLVRRGGPNPLQPRYPVDLADALKAPVLGLYAGRDRGIPLAQVDEMKAALAAAGNVSVAWQIYPDAAHGFHADYRPSYDAEAARDGWRRAREWLETHGAR